MHFPCSMNSKLLVHKDLKTIEVSWDFQLSLAYITLGSLRLLCLRLPELLQCSCASLNSCIAWHTVALQSDCKLGQGIDNQLGRASYTADRAILYSSGTDERVVKSTHHMVEMPHRYKINNRVAAYSATWFLNEWTAILRGELQILQPSPT